MIAFSMQELADYTNCELITLTDVAKARAQINIEEVSTSTQNIGQNCLFIPLKGERFDAHIFIKQALLANVSALVISQDLQQVYEYLKTENSEQEYVNLKQALDNLPILKCTDTLRLLGLTGQLVRSKSHALVCAITGSCGKTTVKEMTANMLNIHSNNKCLFTQGNFNNDVGVPLTLLRFDNNIDFAVVEQGASHLQDIARTAEFVKADFALITNVGEAHIEGFGSRKGVYEGKSEILDELFKNYTQLEEYKDIHKGIAVVSADSPWFTNWQQDYTQQFENNQIVSFGESDKACMQVSNIIEKDNGELSFTLTCNNDLFKSRFNSCEITLNMLGRHNAINFAAASLLALAMGVTQSEIEQSAKVLSGTKGRLMPKHYQNFTLIDDAYNASFNSVIAAIDTLSKQKGYLIFVFGQMGELGEAAEQLHKQVGEFACDKVDLVITYGPLAKLTTEAIELHGSNRTKSLHMSNHDEINSYLINCINSQSYSTCLIKGSHSTHMENVVVALETYGTPSK